MANFDVSKEWVILLPSDASQAKKAAGDLSRYIGLLAGLDRARGLNGLNIGPDPKLPAIVDASEPVSQETIIVLNSGGQGPEHNGFGWRAGPTRVEIYGESGRGLCNGIYSFLAALGISWPAPGQEKLPHQSTKKTLGANPGFPLVCDKAHEPSNYAGSDAVAAPWRRFVPAGKKAVKDILNSIEAFTVWAARQRYDALVFPLADFASETAGQKLRQLRQIAGEYDIAIEAGGRDLSSLVPRSCFFFHRDFFRMAKGKREKAHHFCPTSPGAIRIIGKVGEKLFRAAEGTKVFHLWPDRGAETAWCSCPTCRAFSPAEQNRIGVNAASDVLAAINPDAYITFFEKPGDGGNIPLRKNLFRIEAIPEEKEFPDGRN